VVEIVEYKNVSVEYKNDFCFPKTSRKISNLLPYHPHRNRRTNNRPRLRSRSSQEQKGSSTTDFPPRRFRLLDFFFFCGHFLESFQQNLLDLQLALAPFWIRFFGEVSIVRFFAVVYYNFLCVRSKIFLMVLCNDDINDIAGYQ
jgi:hypothetical protein